MTTETEAPFGSLHRHWHPGEDDAYLATAITRVRQACGIGQGPNAHDPARLGIRTTPETTAMAPGIATLPQDAPDAPDTRTDASPSPQGHASLLAPLPLVTIRAIVLRPNRSPTWFGPPPRPVRRETPSRDPACPRCGEAFERRGPYDGRRACCTRREREAWARREAIGRPYDA